MRDYLKDFITAGMRSRIKARVTLSEIDVSPDDHARFNKIIAAVILNFDVTIADLQKEEKHNGEIKATRAVWALLRTETKMPFAQIASLFGVTKGYVHFGVNWVARVMDKSHKMKMSGIDRKQIIEKITATKKQIEHA